MLIFICKERVCGSKSKCTERCFIIAAKDQNEAEIIAANPDELTSPNGKIWLIKNIGLLKNIFGALRNTGFNSPCRVVASSNDNLRPGVICKMAFY